MSGAVGGFEPCWSRQEAKNAKGKMNGEVAAGGSGGNCLPSMIAGKERGGYNGGSWAVLGFICLRKCGAVLLRGKKMHHEGSKGTKKRNTE